MLCFSIGYGPRRLANYRCCFSIPVWSILKQLGSSSKNTVVHHSSFSCTIRQYCSAPFINTVVHHSSVQFCPIHQFSSAPFVSYQSSPFISSVLHHSLATILRHVIMLFYNSASMNYLATDVNTLCQLFNCITKY